jgi:hypothetical protein
VFFLAEAALEENWRKAIAVRVFCFGDSRAGGPIVGVLSFDLCVRAKTDVTHSFAGTILLNQKVLILPLFAKQTDKQKGFAKYWRKRADSDDARTHPHASGRGKARLQSCYCVTRALWSSKLE